jgi:hypothetical protein
MYQSGASGAVAVLLAVAYSGGCQFGRLGLLCLLGPATDLPAGRCGNYAA